MKKSLIALAVLAAAGAASAQSSVTLYGIADAYVGSVKDALSDASVKSKTVVNSSGLSNSRWGLKGTEDLGGGLKANFVLEAGFDTDTGKAGVYTVKDKDDSTGFGRQATVGLSGNFGAVELGRNYTAYDTVRGATNNSANTNVAMTGKTFGAGIADYTSRTNNSIRFNSNVYSGFSGAVSYALDEDAGVKKDVSSVALQYANGPLQVGYANQTEKQDTASSTTYNMIGAGYNFGVANLVGSVNKAKAAAGKEDTEYQLGVSAPFGATTVYAGLAKAKAEVAGATTEERTGYNLAATYALSKRTTAYAAYMNVDVKDSAKEFRAVAAGVRHAF
jgi:predicted porin